jgi:hypothetical protein
MRKEAYQLRSVAEDVEYLAEAWSDGAVDSELRRGSAILRRLLVDGGNGILVSYWREMGFTGQPLIVAPSISQQVLSARDQVILATAGGATVGGVDIAGYIRALAPIEEESEPESREQPILAYVSSASVIIRGNLITRREVVKYFAHHLGGVHLSRKAMKNDADVVRLLESIETLPTQTHLFGKDLLHFELMAIGQAIGNSEDCRRLAAAIRSRVNG